MLDYPILIATLACLAGFVMTWGVGANDLANIMSTSMGSKAITVRQAIVIAVIFETTGALLGGGNVTETMRDGIIELEVLTNHADVLLYGMLSVLLAGTTWINLASVFGLPVSITHAIVGSVVGFATFVMGPSTVQWEKVGFIVSSWIFSPTLAGAFAYFLMLSMHKLIFGRRRPVRMAYRFIPVYLFLIGLVLSNITVIKGLNHAHITLDTRSTVYINLISGIFLTTAGWLILTRHYPERHMRRRERFNYIEKMFASLVMLTSCAMVFAHGSNDVAVAIGPLTVILSLLKHPGSIALGHYPGWVWIMGITGVIVGFLMYGRKVIATVGSGITALTPSRAFAATLAAATAVVVSTSTGIPVSTTQTLVGAILGVGLARGIGALNMVVIRNIFLSWIVTLPAASTLAVFYYEILYWFS